MKNAFFIFLIGGMMISFSANAQKKKAATPGKEIRVPENIDASFKSSFTVADQKAWTKNYNGNYVANFTNAAHQTQTVEYNASGEIVKSKIKYSPDAVPTIVTSSLPAQYAAATVTDCVRMEIPGVKPYYRVVLMQDENKQKEILISEEGTVAE